MTGPPEPPGKQPSWQPPAGHPPPGSAPGPAAPPWAQGPLSPPPWQPLPDRTPKPGTLRLAPNDVGQTLSAVFSSLPSIIRTVWPGVVALVLNGIVGGLVVVGIVRDREPSPAATVAVLVVGSLLYLLAIVLTMLLVFVAIRTTADGILGRTGAAADAWRTAVRCVPRALSIFALGIGGGIAVGAVTALLVYLGANEHWGAFVLVLLLSLLLLAVAAVICWLKFSYTLPAMLLEGHEPVGDGQALNTRPIGLFAAAGRSWRLTSGRAWRTLGIVLLMSMIVGAATSLVSPIVQIPTSVLSATDSSVVVTTIVSAVSMGFAALMSCLSPIVSGATLTVLYADARIRDEGLGQGVHGYATQGIPANPWIGGGVSARPGEAPWSQIGIVPEVRGGQDGQYR